MKKAGIFRQDESLENGFTDLISKNGHQKGHSRSTIYARVRSGGHQRSQSLMSRDHLKQTKSLIILNDFLHSYNIDNI